MTSWAENVASMAPQWALIVRVEGLGPWLSDVDLTAADDDARYRWCIQVPAYGAAMPAGVWRPTISDMPDTGAEKMTPDEGGAVRMGSTVVGLLDTSDLTAMLATDEPAVTSVGAAISGAVSAGATSTVTVGSTSGLAGQVVYMAGETMRVEAVNSATSLDVTRGYAGSRVLAHEVGAPVYLSPPFFEGRQLSISWAPLDGDSSADEREVGSYRIDAVDFDEASLRRWMVQAVGQLRELERLVAQGPRTFVVSQIFDESAREGSGGKFRLDTPRPLREFRQWVGDTENAYFRNGDEVLTTAVPSALGTVLQTARRGVAGTRVEALTEGAELKQVFVAERNAPGAFRYSPGPTPSTDRTTGTWTPSAQWCDLFANLATSSAHPDDGLELTNYVAAQGNYSSLPAGYGAGILAAEIDWDALRDVQARTAGLDFPMFVFGDEPVSFADLIVENFLRPIGAYLIYVGGMARIVLPRVPVGAASVQIGPADFLARRVGPGHLRPRVQVSRSRATVASQVVYALGPQGRQIVANAPQVRAGIGQRGEYGDPKPEIIPVPGADPADAGVWEDHGERRLARTSRPRVELKADLRPEAGFSAIPGDVIGVTMPELPNASQRTRGWDQVNAQVLAATPMMVVEDRTAEAYVSVEAIGYGSAGRVAAVAPAGRVSVVSGSDATIDANRYTETDAPGGLPTTDAAAFTVGDVVRLVGLDGTDAGGGGTETVDGIAGNVLTLSGDFGGSLATGLVVEFANFDDATATQTAGFAFYADTATQTVGASGGTPYSYGEP